MAASLGIELNQERFLTLLVSKHCCCSPPPPPLSPPVGRGAGWAPLREGRGVWTAAPLVDLVCCLTCALPALTCHRRNSSARASTFRTTRRSSCRMNRCKLAQAPRCPESRSPAAASSRAHQLTSRRRAMQDRQPRPRDAETLQRGERRGAEDLNARVRERSPKCPH